MSYYFTILSPTDVPLFSLTFGTSKAGGDGIARFRFPESARYMNQFIVHASLDLLEEAQWSTGALYVNPHIFPRTYIHIRHTCCFQLIVKLKKKKKYQNIQKIPQTHRYLSTHRSSHLRIPNPLRRPLSSPSPAAAAIIRTSRNRRRIDEQLITIRLGTGGR
jgi:hypothetical protein